MDINVSIIDQRVHKLSEEFTQKFDEQLNIRKDVQKIRSTAFVYLMVKTLLDLGEQEALDAITDSTSRSSLRNSTAPR